SPLIDSSRETLSSHFSVFNMSSTRSVSLKCLRDSLPRDLPPKRLERAKSDASFESITESEDETDESVCSPLPSSHQKYLRSQSISISPSPRLRRIAPFTPLNYRLNSSRKHSLPNLSRDTDELLPPIPEGPVTVTSPTTQSIPNKNES
ncbi:hypothetical protein PRIPAC_88555, partial [Pristionchus pacificus]